ncbi:MAG: hypothetical protein WDO73_29930 [Ignavibacteriota bacterium]
MAGIVTVSLTALTDVNGNSVLPSSSASQTVTVTPAQAHPHQHSDVHHHGEHDYRDV